MRNNLTKKEVSEVPVLELVIRFDYLLEKAETVPLKEITMADAQETVWIEEELRKNMAELERFTKMASGREQQMIKLKKEINDLLKQLGQKTKYRVIN